MSEIDLRAGITLRVAAQRVKWPDRLAGPTTPKAEPGPTKRAPLGYQKQNRALRLSPKPPDSIGGPSRTRTLGPLINSDPDSVPAEIYDDVKLEDLYWD
jgi:hypothetical protein